MSQVESREAPQNIHVRLLIECLSETFRFKQNRSQVRALAASISQDGVAEKPHTSSNAVASGVHELAMILADSPELSLEFIGARQASLESREDVRARLYYPTVLLILAGFAFAISAGMVFGIEHMAGKYFAKDMDISSFGLVRPNQQFIKDLIAPNVGSTLARTIVALFVTSLGGICVVRVFGGRDTYAWFKTLIPLIGSIGRNQLCSEFLRTLGVLLRKDVPLPKALRLAGMITESRVGFLIGHAMARQVEMGVDFEMILVDTKLFPAWLPDWVRLRPSVGGLGEQLTVAAGLIDEFSKSNARLFARVLPFLVFCAAAVMIQYAFMVTFSKLAEVLIFITGYVY